MPAFADAYNLSWTFVVSDTENADQPFRFSDSENFDIDRTGATPGGTGPGLVTVGFAASEVIDFSEFTSLGIVVLKNIDPTNYVDFGPESGGALVPLIRLLPGESFPVRSVPGAVWRAQANTANVRCIIQGFEA